MPRLKPLQRPLTDRFWRERAPVELLDLAHILEPNRVVVVVDPFEMIHQDVEGLFGWLRQLLLVDRLDPAVALEQPLQLPHELADLSCLGRRRV